MAETTLTAHGAGDNIIAFPVRNKGRVRKSNGARAEGAFAMMQFEAYPSNVAHIEQERFAEVELVELLAYAFDAMRASLPPETRQQILRKCLIDAALSDDPMKRRCAAVLSGRFEA